jgi:hypothetical protein
MPLPPSFSEYREPEQISTDTSEESEQEPSIEEENSDTDAHLYPPALDTQVLAITSQESTMPQDNVEFSHRYTLGPNAPTYFSAANENLGQWITSINFLLKFHKDWSKEQKLYAAYVLLRGEAQAWFNSTINTTDEPQSWDDLKKQLKKTFRPKQRIHAYRERLATIKQRDFCSLDLK